VVTCPCHWWTRWARWLRWKGQRQILDGPIDLTSEEEMCSSQALSVSAFWVGAQLGMSRNTAPVQTATEKDLSESMSSHFKRSGVLTMKQTTFQQFNLVLSPASGITMQRERQKGKDGHGTQVNLSTSALLEEISKGHQYCSDHNVANHCGKSGATAQPAILKLL
jgi:hypothetical protein